MVGTLPDFEKHLVREQRRVLPIESETIKKARLVGIRVRMCLQNTAYTKKREELFRGIIRTGASLRP